MFWESTIRRMSILPGIEEHGFALFEGLSCELGDYRLIV